MVDEEGDVVDVVAADVLGYVALRSSEKGTVSHGSRGRSESVAQRRLRI